MRKKKKDKTSKYKGVHSVTVGGCIKWRITGKVDGRMFTGDYKNERVAAMQYDLKMIECGKNPVNILRKK